MDPSYTGPKIEARKSSGRPVVEVPRELELEDQGEEAVSPKGGKGKHVYGSRWVEVEDADGATRFEEVPLTWNDLFDPQEGDWIMHGPEHGDVTGDTKSRLKCLFKARGRDDVVVYDDVRIDWKTPGVTPACPDVAVIPGMTAERAREADVFDEQKEGTSPWFVLEVTSKRTVRYDRTSKPKIYRKAKVPEIFLLDRMKLPWELSGERRNPTTRRYVKIRPDKRGRLLSDKLGVYLSVSASGDDLILEDAETGEVLRKPVEESEDRRAAERQAAEEAEARRQAEERAERAEERAEQGLRTKIEDLCGLLGIEWTAERGAVVAGMGSAQLEALWGRSSEPEALAMTDSGRSDNAPGRKPRPGTKGCEVKTTQA